MNYVDFTKQPQRVISLCTGIRGIERGLELAGVNVQSVCSVEIEALVCANLVAEMEAGVLAPHPIWTNVKTFSMFSERFRGKVHGITGGYPCQPFSLAGQRRGESDPRHLWPSIREIVATVRPVWCFFENVDDHLTMGFDQVYRDLRDMGYTVEGDVFSAAEAGAPHDRQRLFILAVENSSRKRWGRRDNAGSDWGWALQAQGSGGMDNTVRGRQQQEHEVRTGGNVTEPASKVDDTDGHGVGGGLRGVHHTHESERGSQKQHEEQSAQSFDAGFIQMADPNDTGKRAQSKNAKGQAKKVKGKKQRQERDTAFGERSGAESGNEGERAMADSERTGLEGHTGDEHGERGQRTGEDRPTAPRGVSLWPARPGQRQHEWEHPRTLRRETESDVGLSVDGYAFREDFLRAVGNAVVPQTAAIAWSTLWNKMFE